MFVMDEPVKLKIERSEGVKVGIFFKVLSFVLFIGLGFSGYYIYTVLKKHEDDKANYITTLEGRDEEIKDLQSELLRASRDNKTLQEANENLRQGLKEEMNTVDVLVDRIKEITGEVETIRRLEYIDQELLKKYSRVYFLNENYEPAKLVSIPADILAPIRDKAYFHDEAWPFLRDMINNAKGDGINLRVVSGFRSFNEQTELKSSYDMIYGQGTANQFSASQGYSEHQLGTAVDFSTEENAGMLDGFENTEAYTWLKGNAHRFGFVLSYPEGNAYYQFEPWHWRFVGVKLASDLFKKSGYFYDLDQRDIDEFRLYIFDR